MDVARVALALLRDETQSTRIHREAANLLRRIDPPTRSRIINALSAESRRRIAHIVAQGSAVADHEVDAMIRGLEVRLRQTTSMTRWAPTLDRLVRTVATTTHDEERGQALAVLMLTPQAPALAAAYAAQLRSASTHDEPTLVDDALGVLSWLVQPDQAEDLVELAFRAGTDPITTLTAAGAAGNARVSRRTAARITSRTSALAAEQLQRAARRPEEPGPGARLPARHVGPDVPARGPRPAGGRARGEPGMADVVPVVARPARLGAAAPAAGLTAQASSCARLVAGRPVSDSMSLLTASSSPARMAV